MSIMKYKLYGMSNQKFLFESFLLFVLALTAYAIFPEGALGPYKGYVKILLLPFALAYTYAGARFRWPRMALPVLATGSIFWAYLLITELLK